MHSQKFNNEAIGSELESELLALMAEGRTVEAIKRLRAANGWTNACNTSVASRENGPEGLAPTVGSLSARDKPASVLNAA
jgi:hypothetical protein